MIVTFINNHKLYIQFDRVVQKGLIQIESNSEFEETKKVINSDFEIINLPEKITIIKITINIGETKIFRTIKTG